VHPGCKSPIGESDGGAIILLHKSRANSGGRRPEISFSDPAWWYHQKWRRGNNRSYSGRVEYAGGTEVKRIRRDLAAVIADLLAWAQRDSREDRDAV
jgi:hypothetical protein